MQERTTARGFCGSSRVRRVCLERIRALKGPLLVECGWSFLFWPGIVQLRNCPGVNVYKFPCSHRRQHGATVILSSRVDPVDLHGAQYRYSCDSQRCLGKRPAVHSKRVVRSLAQSLMEVLRQEMIETHLRRMLPTYPVGPCEDEIRSSVETLC